MSRVQWIRQSLFEFLNAGYAFTCVCIGSDYKNPKMVPVLEEDNSWGDIAVFIRQ
jgi:hypothetical protein